ncbi:MAG: hypothetical protein WCC06_08155 [Candidatus Aminicenantales bacterium]
MKFHKICVLLSLLLFCISLAFTQDLVELAKKEKQRRESLKGMRRIIVTNADLLKVKKKPALSTPPPSESEEVTESELPEEEASETESAPETTLGAQQNRELQIAAQKKLEETKAEYEEIWKKATEYRELLGLKMNALWQEFYSMDDMTPRDLIQRAISDTYLKLQGAQNEEARAKEEYERFVAQAEKEKTTSIWFR